MNQQQAKAAAKAFADKWAGRGDEKQDTQSFWNELLRTVYGIENTEEYIKYEKRAKIDNTTKFIDGYIPATKVLIEQKGAKIDLNKAERQSDGQMLTPYQQGRRYILGLAQSEYPKWIVTCNFQEFHIHDMDRPNDAPQVVYLKDLPKEYERLTFLVNLEDKNTARELDLSQKAGDLVGAIYDAFLAQFKAVRTPTDADLKSLNILCVRLVFCYYAEDAGLFESAHSFKDYITSYRPEHLRQGLIQLFDILDTPEDKRDPFAEKALTAFPYVNGRLFRDDTPITIPPITEEIKQELLSADTFDWSDISPTIFGAVFESTLDSKMRRKGGMHYTSIENIHKVIDPLFLDDLKAELKDILEIKGERKRTNALKAYQDKLASLTFLDPACGSGNFLTESYRWLRKLENRVIAELHGNQIFVGDTKQANPIKVSISQFYGIEINDFAVAVAKTALWIAESQMLQATESIVKMPLDFLPLTTNANIVEGNALRIDWESVVPKERLNFIMGNPPFVGTNWMTEEQRLDMNNIWGKKRGKLDYVACWYAKASSFIENSNIDCAFVSTNSICQGEQATTLWDRLLIHEHCYINFAVKTFKWNNESIDKAQVHVVIIGFSKINKSNKFIYSNNSVIFANNINQYLLNAPTIIIRGISKPLCNVPSIVRGSQATDNGLYLFTELEKNEFIKQEPKARKYIKQFMMGREFINNIKRYCLWMPDITSNELKQMPKVLERVKQVKEFRKNSKNSQTKRAADVPWRFGQYRKPSKHYIAFAKVSSEKRHYMPFGFLTDEIIPGDKLFTIPKADLYMFGIMTSNVHMAWMRTVCGRMKSDYSYSTTIVYNNFPWPTVDDKQKERIEKTAQAILDARALYPDASLTDLYDETTMPKELRDAHRQNDRAVMLAYGFTHNDKNAASKWYDESETVAALMKMYQKLTEKK